MTENENNLTSIVLDEDDATTSDDTSKVEDKINEFKKKAETNSATVDNSASQVNSASQTSNSTIVGGDLLKTALIEFKNQDYQNAFSKFKQLAESGNVQAQNLLGNMYINGLGISYKDPQKGIEWIKKAANGGDITSQYEYGKYCLSSNKADEAFAYLELAGDADDAKARQEYIDFVINYVNLGEYSKRYKKEIDKAITYCEALRDDCKDSFDKEQYDKKMRSLEKRKKSINKKYSDNGTPVNGNVKDTIGVAILWILVILFFITAAAWMIMDFAEVLVWDLGDEIGLADYMRQFDNPEVQIHNILRVLIIAEAFLFQFVLSFGCKAKESLEDWPLLLKYEAIGLFIISLISFSQYGLSAVLVNLGWLLVFEFVGVVAAMIVGIPFSLKKDK